MKYVAVRDNFGFMGAYWKEGAIVESDKLPNKHFRKLEEPKSEPVEVMAETEQPEKKTKRAKKA